MTDGKEPMFATKVDPQSESENKNYYFDGNDINYFGLTKREYFAAMAMQGVLSSDFSRLSEYVVEKAIKVADELIKQLNKQP